MAGIGGFNPNQINAQFAKDLASGKNPGLQTAKTASGADSSAAAGHTKTPKSKPAKEGVVLSAAAQAEAKKAQTETGETQQQVRDAGGDIDGDYKSQDDLARNDDIAKEKSKQDVPVGGMKLATKDGTEFILDAKQTEVIEKHYNNDPAHLDDQYEKLMKDWTPEQRAAIEATVESQIAQKGGSVKQAFGHLKPLPAELTNETAKPVLESVPSAGPVEIRGADTNSKAAPTTITPELPPETEASAKEFAQKQALSGEGGTQEALIAGVGAMAATNGTAKTEKTTAAEAVQSAPVLSEAKAQELLQLSQKSLIEANNSLVSNVAYEGVAMQLKQAKDQMVQQGATPAQAREQIGQAVRQNGQQLQESSNQAAQEAIGKIVHQKADEAKAEAKEKGFALNDGDAILVAQMRMHNENLSKTAQENKLSELMGPDSGVPSARDLMKKHVGEDGTFNAGAFSQDMKAAIDKHEPAIHKKMQDLQAQAKKTNDPVEKEKLLNASEELEAHYLGFHDAFTGAVIVDSAKSALVAREIIDSKGASANPKSLALLDNGSIQLDKGADAAAAGGAGRVTVGQLEAKSSDDWNAFDASMKKAGIKEEDAEEIKKNVKKKADAIAADDPGGKNEPGEFVYICQAAELANYASRQMANVDPNSEQGKAFAGAAQNGFAYIESREAFLNAQLPDSVKNNPSFQTYKSEWMKAKSAMVSR